MAFEKGKPEPGIKAKLLDDRVRGNNDFIQPAINNEHNFVDADANNQSGDHTQGSARCFFAATAPAVRIDTTSFVETDNGSLWINSGDNALSIMTDYSQVVAADKWTLVSDEVIATLLAQANSFTGIQTFTSNIEGKFVKLTSSDETLLELISTDPSARIKLSDDTTTAPFILFRVGNLLTINPTSGDTRLGSATGSDDRSIADRAYVDAIGSLLPSASLGGSNSINETSVGNLHFKWGIKSVGASASQLLDFTTEGLSDFNNACSNVQVSFFNDSTSNSAPPGSHTATKTGFTLYNSQPNTRVISWRAIGW